ncbi:MAG TPA: hypothetical protein LFV92_04675 [Rickettsia endosymbiont of Ceroptres masudai]|nr:hypothetical protein [Rickettsia endosymbiont of Ceroptres masudai]
MSFLAKSGNPVIKRCIQGKFLKLKARFISLFSGCPPSREGVVTWILKVVIARSEATRQSRK